MLKKGLPLSRPSRLVLVEPVLRSTAPCCGLSLGLLRLPIITAEVLARALALPFSFGLLLREREGLPMLPERIVRVLPEVLVVASEEIEDASLA